MTTRRKDVLAAVILITLGLFLYRMRAKRPPGQATFKSDTPLTPQAQLYKLQKNEKFWGVSIESHCSASSRLAGKATQHPVSNKAAGIIIL